MRDLATWHLTPAQIGEGFPEIARLRECCQFRDCEHVEEPGCAVRRQLDEELVRPTRYASYLALLDELRADTAY